MGICQRHVGIHAFGRYPHAFGKNSSVIVSGSEAIPNLGAYNKCEIASVVSPLQ